MSVAEYREMTKAGKRPRADVRVAARVKAALHDQLRAEVSGAVQTFDLTLAPSVNSLYANVPGKGRVKTKLYRQWIKAALGELVSQRAKPAAWPVEISIILPESMNGDADGRFKATTDIFVKGGIIPDDSKKYVRAHSITFGDCERMRVSVAPWPLFAARSA